MGNYEEELFVITDLDEHTFEFLKTDIMIYGWDSRGRISPSGFTMQVSKMSL